MILSLVMLHLCKLTVKWDGSRIGGEGKRSIANSAGQGFFFSFPAGKIFTKKSVKQLHWKNMNNTTKVKALSK